MEAKDTVIGRKIYEGDGVYEERVKQAKISFKLGATQAIAKTIKPAGVLYEKAEQVGMRKVVEWVDKNFPYSVGDVNGIVWQAQKKVWGINNEDH